MDIGVAEDRILDDRDALHDGTDAVGTFFRVGLAFEQQCGLKLDEVFLVLLDKFLEVFRRVVACELIGILSAGQQQNPETHAFREQHVGTAQGCMYAGSVAVVDERDV